MPKSRMRSYLIFTGTGPILVLSTYPKLTDDRLLEKLRYKGIDRSSPTRWTSKRWRSVYPQSFEQAQGDLEGREDIRVLDFNGHQIMANFSVDSLGDPIKFGG